jgi:hypothetical protein
MSWRVRLLGLAGVVAFGCTSGPTAPSSASAACTPHSASANAVLPVFGRPFDGAFPIGNFFDHDKPIEGDANRYVLTLCGARDASQVDGHPGYDWRMPEGTPLLAVANAVVMTAGLEAPNFCPQLNRTVQALLVVLVHTAPTGELYASIYGHLSRVDVQAGASVSEGTVIGLSVLSPRSRILSTYGDAAYRSTPKADTQPIVAAGRPLIKTETSMKRPPSTKPRQHSGAATPAGGKELLSPLASCVSTAPIAACSRADSPTNFSTSQ